MRRSTATGTWSARRRRSCHCAPAEACSARTRVPRAARAVRRGRQGPGAARAARRRPTSARACSPSAACMDKVVFKDLMAHAGIAQVAYAAWTSALARRPRGRPRRRRARAAGVREAGAAGLVGRDRRGSPRADELDAALEQAFSSRPPRDRRGCRAGTRGRVLGARPRPRRAGRASRGRSSLLGGAGLVRLRGEVHRRWDGAQSCRRGSPRRARARARAGRRAFRERAAAGSRAPTSSSTASAYC